MSLVGSLGQYGRGPRYFESYSAGYRSKITNSPTSVMPSDDDSDVASKIDPDDTSGSNQDVRSVV